MYYIYVQTIVNVTTRHNYWHHIVEIMVLCIIGDYFDSMLRLHFVIPTALQSYGKSSTISVFLCMQI